MKLSGNPPRKGRQMRRTEGRFQPAMLLYCLFVAFCFLTVCSKSSFLYPLNNGSDSHCFFTVGKGMMNGLVPYRDLVEQKGPLLYFLYGLASLVSSRSFFGVYLLELLAYTAFLYCSYQIFALFFKPAVSKFFYIAAPLMAAVTFTSPSFFHGGESEELILPLLAFTLYLLLRYCREEYPKRPMPLSWLLLAGVCAGCVLWIKFTLLGFWIGFMAAVFLSLLVTRNFARAVASCFVFLGGMAATALPWIAYFGAQGALRDLFQVYFYNNIFSYSAPMALADRFASIGGALLRMLSRTPWLFGAAAIGLVGLLALRGLHKNWLGAFSPLLCAVCLAVGLYWGGQQYTYYFFVFSGFTALAAAVLTHLAVTLGGRRLHPRAAGPGRRLAALASALTVVLAGAAYFFCENTYLLGTPKEQCVQYRFAEIIRETERPTLLNYGFLDTGFYFAADVLPVNRYFCRLNIPEERLPEMNAQQNQIIREKGVDYVVVMINVETDVYSLQNPELFRNYEVVAQQVDIIDNRQPQKFVLFRAKGIAASSAI